jgi:hypothetical protein
MASVQISVVRTGILLCAFWTGLHAVHAEDWVQQWAQVQNKLAELQRIAALPEDQQRADPNRATLNAWFMTNVLNFGNALNGSAIGSAGMVNLHSARYGAVLNRLHIIFRRVERPGFMPGDNVIQLPMTKVSLDIGSDNTAWHELFHAQTDPQTIAIDPKPWLSYLDNEEEPEPYRSRQDHVYSEGLAQHTYNWLRRLVVPQRFEQEAKIAWQKLHEYQQRNEVVNWQVENYVWGKCRSGWVKSWKEATTIAPLPENLRDECLRLTEVRTPTVEDVIGFYMRGGVQATIEGRDEGVRIPRWVMERADFRVPAVVEDELATVAPTLRLVKDRLETSIRFLMVEARIGTKYPLTSGRVTVSLDDAGDENASLALSLGNQVIHGSPIQGGTNQGRTDRFFEIPDLVVHQDLIKTPLRTPFNVTFSRNKAHTLHALSKPVTYRITVSFSPATKPNEKPLYEPTKAVYLVTVDPKDLTGLPKTPPKDPASNTTGKSSDPATGKTPTRLKRIGPEVEAEYGALPEGWIIGKPEDFGNKTTKPLIFFKEVKRFGSLYGYVEVIQRAPNRLANFKTAAEHARVCTDRDKQGGWTFKAKETRIGELPAFEAMVGGLEAGSGLRAIYWLRPADNVEIDIFAQDSPGSFNPKTKAEYDQAHTQIKREAYTIANSLIFHLPLGGKITKEAAPTPPLDPVFKNEPPKPGEIIALRPPTDAERKELANHQDVPVKDSKKKIVVEAPPDNTSITKSSGAGYSPPGGGYTIPVPAGWMALKRQPGDAQRIFVGPGGDYTLACPDTKRELPKDFSVFSTRLVETLRTQNPTAQVSGQDGMVIVQLTDGGKPTWLVFAGSGRQAWCFTVLAQKASASTLPPVLQDAFRSIRWEGGNTR